jgi:hypothetical protein
MTAWSRVALPHGLWREGERHGEAQIRPLTGADEAFLLESADGLSRAETVSRMLSRCVGRIGTIEPPDLDDVRDLSVGDREALLLHLRGLSFGGRISCVAHCPAGDCGEPMDLEFDTDDLLVPPVESDGACAEARLEGGREAWIVTYRVPTGGDQEAIAATARSDVDDAVAILLDRCVVSVADAAGATVPVEQALQLLQANLPQLMSERDPQAEIRLSLCCPVCAHGFGVIFDAAEYLTSELSARGRTIFDEVHLIARRYHWSEAEILSLSVGRRRRYLSLIFDEMSVERRA